MSSDPLIPKRLADVLSNDPDLNSSIGSYIGQFRPILVKNDTRFFPDYTDHGIAHVGDVLKSEVELIPEEAWPLLGPKDAAVIIGATLLHDFAMHLSPVGFRELVSADSRFKPLPWFEKEQRDHRADRPWSELWNEYKREVRLFSEAQLADIVGLPDEDQESGASSGKAAVIARDWNLDGLSERNHRWNDSEYRIVGEFIRRHHARLAHEIAIFGFPGLKVGRDPGEFQALEHKGHGLEYLADLIGLTARSHGMDLRVCVDYLAEEGRYDNEVRPRGVVAVYAMALLRVADYFQIDKGRTPPVLLQLRNPQSPITLDEWGKHAAVPSISNHGLWAKVVNVRTDVSLRIFLLLKELLKNIQQEIDHSSAVLDEVYVMDGTGLEKLRLQIKRVRSNMDKPDFLQRLPYVPEKVGYAADPHLLGLLVEPLYGDDPSIGIRELMQNAVDAVRELKEWQEKRGVSCEVIELAHDADVLVEYVEGADSSGIVRVSDRGIGMTADTIMNYFLKAGASFRNSPDWMKEYVADDGKPSVARSGRFGIGVFALFLIGSKFRMWTRHAGGDGNSGCFLEASADDSLIEIRRERGLKVGTVVEVEVSSKRVLKFVDAWAELVDDLDCVPSLISSTEDKRDPTWFETADWFCWEWPRVVRSIQGAQGSSVILPQEEIIPFDSLEKSPEWAAIYPDGYQRVFWQVKGEEVSELSCNGFIISGPYWRHLMVDLWDDGQIAISRPSIAIEDPDASLPLKITRSSLSGELPFMNLLLEDICHSIVAHALVMGPRGRFEAIGGGGWYPLLQMKGNPRSDEGFAERVTRQSLWEATGDAFVINEKTISRYLPARSHFVFGLLPASNDVSYDAALGNWIENESDICVPDDCAVLMVDVPDLGSARYELGIIGVTRGYWAARLFHAVVDSFEVLLSDPHLRFVKLPEQCHASFRADTGTLWRHHAVNRSYGSLDLANLVKQLEKCCPPKQFSCFAAEYSVVREQSGEGPPSLLATVWGKCIGPRAIPFLESERNELIEEAIARDSVLKVHVEKWRELRRRGEGKVEG